jgi:hypothetical protein
MPVSLVASMSILDFGNIGIYLPTGGPLAKGKDDAMFSAVQLPKFKQELLALQLEMIGRGE